MNHLTAKKTSCSTNTTAARVFVTSRSSMLRRRRTIGRSNSKDWCQSFRIANYCSWRRKIWPANSAKSRPKTGWNTSDWTVCFARCQFMIISCSEWSFRPKKIGTRNHTWRKSNTNWSVVCSSKAGRFWKTGRMICVGSDKTYSSIGSWTWRAKGVFLTPKTI